MKDGRLEVTEEILERVVYGMENQKDRLLLDPTDGILRPDSENTGTFIPLPPWGPTEGYRLMDSFAGTLPNTIFRDRVLDILHSGTGVFRRFKDALKERPELEGLWRRHKKREMRTAALVWLNRWSEALALEALGPEPEEWDELASIDFTVRAADIDDIPTIRVWNQGAESFSSIPESGKRPGIEPENILVVENPSGELVGFAQIDFEEVSGREEGRLMYIFVVPEFRGLGLGRLLTTSVLELFETRGVEAVSVRTGGSGGHLKHYLENSGFTPVVTWWRKSL